MANIEKTSRKRIGSSSYFLGCFGFSKRKDAVVDGGDKKTTKKKRSRWFLCSKFRVKSGEIKPAPTEETERPTSRVEDETEKQTPISVIRSMTDHKNTTADNNIETEQTKPNDLEDKTLDRSERTEPLDSLKEDTCQQEKISKLTRFKKFDPLIGISIIIMTLVTMLIWGRLYAILCTSAWCYFLHRLRNAAERKRSGSEYVLDFNSEFHKAKVLLDGFLGRPHRVPVL